MKLLVEVHSFIVSAAELPIDLLHSLGTGTGELGRNKWWIFFTLLMLNVLEIKNQCISTDLEALSQCSITSLTSYLRDQHITNLLDNKATLFLAP